MNSATYNYISLDDWQLVKVSGPDNHTYLQGQLTIDMNSLTEQNATFAAHCDPKGKMWSNMLVFKRGDDIFYIVRKSVVEKQVTELKKYAVFTKVAIEPVHDLNMVGMIGEIHPAILNLLGEDNCATPDHTTYITLPFPEKRLLMISSEPLPDERLPTIEWLKLDLFAGYPIIDAENMGSLLPQACNLDKLGAISFEKGCYCGQEMVARAQFRGINKRGMYLLRGSSPQLPNLSERVECLVEGNWRETGQVLAAFKQSDEQGADKIYVQVILSNDFDINTKFRIKGVVESKLELYG